MGIGGKRRGGIESLLKRFVIIHRQNGGSELHRILRFDLYDAAHEVFFGNPFRIIFKEDGPLAGRKLEGLFLLLRIHGFSEREGAACRDVAAGGVPADGALHRERLFLIRLGIDDEPRRSAGLIHMVVVEASLPFGDRAFIEDPRRIRVLGAVGKNERPFLFRQGKRKLCVVLIRQRIRKSRGRNRNGRCRDHGG